MRASSKVSIRTKNGQLVQAPCYWQWKQNIGGMDFEFALHVAAGYGKGFQAPLAISELNTGFDVKADIRHAGHTLTTSNVVTLQSGTIKRLAKAALHHLIYKKVGPMNFLQAILGAQMQLSNIDIKPYQHTIGGTMTTSFTNEALLARLKAAADGSHPVVMPEQEACLACDDTKVLTTTDMDHEGQPIEVTCTECIPKSIEVVETTVAQMMSHPDWSGPTEEEWYEGLEPENKLEYLIQKRAGIAKDMQALLPKATKADHDRIDSMDDDLRDLDAKIKALTLDGLKLRLDALNDQAAQHGTMTGDLTENQYEDLAYNICSLEKEIHDLENQ